MTITRKDFLKGTAAGALGMLLPQSASPSPFPAETLPEIAPGNLPNADELWSWLEKLAGWCPASTGSAGHTAFVNFLDQQLRAAKLTPQRKTFKLPYWEPKAYGVKAGEEKFHATGYRPYCGTTPPSGVTAALYNAGTQPNLDYSGAAGKIALVEVAPAPNPSAPGLVGQLVGTYPPNSTVPNVRYGAVLAYRSAPDLKQAEKAGAAGVIYIWNNVSDGNAQDQAVPFTGPPSPVPAVWVTQSAGRKLRSLAASFRQSDDARHYSSGHADRQSVGDTTWQNRRGDYHQHPHRRL